MSVDNAKDVLQWIGRNEVLVQLLEPLFLYGVALSFVFVALCFFFKQEPGRKIGMVVLIICCAAFYPYLKFTEKSLEDIRKNPEFAAPGHQLVIDAMEKQYEKRYESQWIYYGLALIAGLSLVTGKSKLTKAATILAALISLWVVFFGLYMDMRDKMIHYNHLWDPNYVLTDGESGLKAVDKDGKKKKKDKQ